MSDSPQTAHQLARTAIETVGAELRTVLRSYVDTSAGGFWTLQEQDANGHSVVHTYDALHREVSTQDAARNTSRTYFDAVVQRAALDRKGFLTSFEYDGANRLLAQREFDLAVAEDALLNHPDAVPGAGVIVEARIPASECRATLAPLERRYTGFHLYRLERRK